MHSDVHAAGTEPLQVMTYNVAGPRPLPPDDETIRVAYISLFIYTLILLENRVLKNGVNKDSCCDARAVRHESRQYFDQDQGQ